MLHAVTDHAVTRALEIGFLYREGFGDVAVLSKIADLIETYSRARDPGEVVLRDMTPMRTVAGGKVRSAAFESPAPTPLPKESRAARVELWLPERHLEGAMCIVLASTAEEGFLRRRPLAKRLLADGIGSILLESPFYGTRRPRGQRGPVLRTVADQLAMSTAMVDEARALLTWAHRQGYFPGVTGYSQGGFMGAFASALVDFPSVCVPRAAGTHAAPVLTEWPLSRAVHWPSLAREAGSVAAARAQLRHWLRHVDLRLHAAPVAPELATVIIARHDRIFPPHTGMGLHAHWRGSELVMSDAGHLTSALVGSSVHTRAVVEAFRRARLFQRRA